MKLFLTSSHTLGWAGDLNPANGFAEALAKALAGKPIRCVVVSSYPDDIEITDRMAWEIRECFDRADLSFDHYEVLDRRTVKYAAKMFKKTNFVILCGGHVPTENKFFNQINLKKRLSKFDGVVMGISAGSMNCASRVYCPPELEGEAADKNYINHLEGLGYTDINILPHFQNLRGVKIDGLNLIKEFILPDSFEHPVWCLPDGTYFFIEGDNIELSGKAYKAQNGKLRLVCHDNERKRLMPNGSLRKIQ